MVRTALDWVLQVLFFMTVVSLFVSPVMDLPTSPAESPCLHPIDAALLLGAEVGCLSVESVVEARLFVGVRHAYGCDLVDGPQQGVGDDEGPGDTDQHAHQLRHEEGAVSVEQAICPIRIHALGSQKAKSKDPHGATDTVDSPNVERVVPVLLLAKHDSSIGDTTGEDPDQHRALGCHEASCRGDGSQAGNRTDAEPDQCWFLL